LHNAKYYQIKAEAHLSIFREVLAVKRICLTIPSTLARKGPTSCFQSQLPHALPSFLYLAKLGRAPFFHSHIMGSFTSF